jgi:hypothetical protein
MSMQAFEASSCGCCMSRRRFLATGCGACAAAALPAAFSWASEAAPSVTSPDRPRVRLVFACWAVVQDRPTWPHLGHDFAPDIERVSSGLKKLCPDVELLPTVLHTPEAAEKLLAADKAQGIDGYVVYHMNNWIKVMEPIVTSGRPTLVADFLFAGSGGFVTYTSQLRRQYHNFSVVSSSRIEDLAEAVECFSVLKRGGTTADFVAACDRARKDRTGGPTATACKDDPVRIGNVGQCLEAMKRSKLLVVGAPMQPDLVEKTTALTGIGITLLDYPEVAAACNKVDRDASLAVAARWRLSARSVTLTDVDGTLEKSARFYLAQKALVEQYRADGITVNCLGGVYSGKVNAYPCLGFVEMLDAGMIGACEADLMSSVTMIAMKHLTGRPGFISDPVLDTSKRQIIYAHCVATTKPFGPQGAANPYEILSHSEDRGGASVRSFLPIGYKVTTMKVHPGRREILCHRAKAVENVVNDLACRTKLACEVEGDMEKLFTFWDQYSWHRVTFYGDLWEPAQELAAALGFKFVAET